MHNYSYNVKNQLTNLAVNNNSGAIASYAYTVDAAGHRTQVTELSGRTVKYGYDSLYRLTSETISGASSQNGAINYVYDSVGNRTSMTSTVPAIPAGTFSYDANDRSGTDVYDAEGNTVGSGGLAYVYDFENHLVQQGGATFVYDGDGNRVQKIVAGNVTHYFVDSTNPSGYPQVLAEETATNFGFTNYTWGLELISRVDFSSGQPIYFLHDGHGSVRELTNPSGAVTDTYDYDAFGNLLHSTGTTPNNYLFADEQFDPNLNLYYNRARYLSTNTGRFWSMDTYEGDDEQPLTLHKYLYTNANPVDGTDRSGNQDSIAELDTEETMIGTFAAMPQIQVLLRPPQPIELKYKTVLNDPPRHLWEVEWGLTHATMRGGWIVQHIRIKVPRRRNYDYWEAWQVLMQSRKTATLGEVGYDDAFQGPTGSTFNAEARFYEGLALLALFIPNNPDTAAHDLPSTTIDPDLPPRNATPPNDRWWVAP